MNKKTIWITGASSGIGEASAKKFAKEGWKVIISARRVELLEKLSTDENIFSYPLDVTDSVKAKEVFKKINFKYFLHLFYINIFFFFRVPCPC